MYLIFVNIDDSCDNKKCGQACNWELDVAGRCDKKGKCSLDYSNLGCQVNGKTYIIMLIYNFINIIHFSWM